jgi:hypothetical protein
MIVGSHAVQGLDDFFRFLALWRTGLLQRGQSCASASSSHALQKTLWPHGQ